MQVRTLALAGLLVLASLAPVAGAATDAATAQTEVGTYTSYGTTSNAVVDYRVNGETMVEEMKVQSSGSGNLDVGASLSSTTHISGASISGTATAETSATVEFASGAEMTAHDNDRGIFVLRAGGGTQYVQANTSSGGSAQAAGENRIVVTNGDGAKGTFILVGEGDVTVNQAGNVTAKVEQGSKLVFRSYAGGERSESDEHQEQLIAEGEAAAEVYVQQGSEATADVVSYSEGTTVEVTQKSESRIEMTAQRSRSQGKVIITSASQGAFESADEVNVTVDGEAAARASSYSEVAAASNGGSQSKYLVRSSSSAQASTDVVVGVNGFSERTVTMEGSGGGGGVMGAGPGFGSLVTLSAIAAVGALLFARSRL